MSTLLVLPLSLRAQGQEIGETSSISAGAELKSLRRIISGELEGGIPWTAANLIVGTTSTATQAGGGNPLFFPTMPAHSGVATLIITKGSSGSFICSGSLLDDRRSILTAAHCVTNNLGHVNATAATAYFYDGSSSPPYDPDTVVYASPASTAVNISNYYVAPSYSGNVIDDNDLAVLRLVNNAPGFASDYDLFANDLTSLVFNVAGYGRRSNAGGNIGDNLSAGILRQGDNRYDFQWGDANFNGAFSADVDFMKGLHTWAADFDNGLAANDAGCLISAAVNPALNGNPIYCNLGVGAKEAAIAGGDSGGPGFIGGEIATINSYGLTFGSALGDIDSSLDTSFGEFSGYVPVSRHIAFIESVKVPGPLPIAGAATLMAWSRRLRKRIACSPNASTMG